ncbi:deoxyribose-phosphate aldolase [Penicillium sp. IBT 18751x]|nr:deoxyribose-phosphate aldolase [Penicillium sp. IBT 18751x]
MTSIPSTNAEWAELITQLRGDLPARSYAQPAIPSEIPGMIDHTLLTVGVEADRVNKICEEAMEHEFASVCVRLENVPRAVAKLKDARKTVVACVVGFHEGTYETSEKVEETKKAVAQGAKELDMVINYPMLKQGQYTAVYEDVLAVRKAAPPPVIIKAIIETSQLDEDEIVAATVICCMAEVDFVKTSTGLKGGGATVENVTLMRLVADRCGTKKTKIKASGGIRSASDCVKLIRAGAHRIGTSAGVAIVKEVDADDGLLK